MEGMARSDNYARTLEELRFRFLNAEGAEIEADERMKNFALRYAKRFAKGANGGLPYGAHEFPNTWDTTFYIDFGGPNGFEDEIYQRWKDEQSGNQA